MRGNCSPRFDPMAQRKALKAETEKSFQHSNDCDKNRIETSYSQTPRAPVAGSSRLLIELDSNTIRGIAIAIPSPVDW